MSNFLEFEVGTADLRRGLQAVLPHVNGDKDAPDTHRVRVEVGTDSGDESAELVLMATDGWTAAVYAAHGGSVVAQGIDYFDLHPADVTKILAVFRAGVDDDPEFPDSVLRFHVTEKLVKVRDISGLFEGHELELPATPEGQWPRIALLMADHLEAPTEATRWRIQLTGKFLARFATSAKFIGSPLVFDISRAPLLVQCSDVFAGVVMPQRITEDQAVQFDDRRASWGRSLRRVGVEQAARRAEDAVDERLAAAVRFVGARQVVTLKGLRGELGIGQAETQSVLTDMEARGLIGPKIGRKAQPALFSPDEVDAVLQKIGDADDHDRFVLSSAAADPGFAADIREAAGETLSEPVDDVASDPGESSGLDEFAPVPTSWGPDAAAQEDQPPAGEWVTIETSTFDDPEPVIETVFVPDPFSDRPVAPDPFRDSDGNTWPTRDPFDAA